MSLCPHTGHFQHSTATIAVALGVVMMGSVGQLRPVVFAGPRYEIE
jgi:hypothetical protein